MKRVHLYIRGDVIGVGFRAWAKIQAKANEVTGWVRNLDNEVEAVVQGEEEKVNKMVRLLKSGPLVSRVEAVDIAEEETKENFGDFEIKK